MGKLSAFLVAAALLLVAESARAQNMADAPLGTSFQGTAKLGPRQIPLPPGNWSLLLRDTTRSSGGGTTSVPLLRAYLIQLAGGKLDRWIFVNTNLAPSPFGWTRDRNICDRADVHVSVSDTNYNTRDTECWIVNHQGMTSGGNVSEIFRSFYDQTNDKGRPTTALCASFYIVKSSDYLTVNYCQNPELSGFAPTPTAEWRGNQWHRDLISQDPNKVAFVAKMKAEAESLLPLVKRGMSGQL